MITNVSGGFFPHRPCRYTKRNEKVAIGHYFRSVGPHVAFSPAAHRRDVREDFPGRAACVRAGPTWSFDGAFLGGET